MSAGVATASAPGLKPSEDMEAAPMVTQTDTGVSEMDEDLYTRLKTLQRQLEFLEIQVSNENFLSFEHPMVYLRRPTLFPLLATNSFV